MLRKVLFIVFVAGIVIALALRIWSHDPAGVESTTRTVALFIATGLFIVLYVNRVARRVITLEQFQFNLQDLLLMTTAVVILSAAGFAFDGLMLVSFLIYAATVWPLCHRVVIQWTKQNEPATTCWTSALIVSVFTLVVTVIAATLLLSIWPKDVMFPTMLLMMLWTSAMFAWLFILGDNAQDSMQLVLYGLPVGVSANIVLGLMAGALLGGIAVVVRTITGNRIHRPDESISS